MSIKRLFDAVERRGDIGRRVAAFVLPISNRPRVTSSCAGKIGLREPGEHTSGPNLPSRDNVAHNPTLYTILETLPPVIPLCRKQALTYAIKMVTCWSGGPPSHALVIRVIAKQGPTATVRHGAMNPAGKVRCNIMAMAKGYSCVSQPFFIARLALWDTVGLPRGYLTL